MKAKETISLNNDHVGHMVEYLFKHIQLRDLDKLRGVVEQHIQEKFPEEWSQKTDLEFGLFRSLESKEGVVSRSKRVRTDEHLSRIGSWKPDAYVQYVLRGPKNGMDYAKILQLIYPVEVKCDGAGFERGQGSSARNYDLQRVESAIKLKIDTDYLPKKLSYSVSTVDTHKEDGNQ